MDDYGRQEETRGGTAPNKTFSSLTTNEGHPMPERLITDQEEFNTLCNQIRDSGIVGFDTEFVAEYYYRPRLCLLQLATPTRVCAVDPFEVADLSAWWALMADAETTIIVHGGREEIRFCQEETGRLPQRLVDVQLAEGLLSRSYPLSYKMLTRRVLGSSVHDRETRTDWRNRPLTKPQVDYALDDVRHLLEVWDRQRAQLLELNRLEWAEAEFARFIGEAAPDPNSEPWRRLSGVHKLSRRSLAVARELYFWRDALAEQRDRPPRNVFRDDLLIEIAKRQPDKPQQILAIRGMDRRDYKKLTDAILQCVQAGQAVPESELPHKSQSNSAAQKYEVLAKLLGIALAQCCAEAGIATTLVGTTADLHELVQWHLSDRRRTSPPALMQGWRGEVCGDLLGDVLDGKVSLRVIDPTAEAPLRFERVSD